MPHLVIDARMLHSSGIGVYLRQLIPFLTRQFEVTLLSREKEAQEAHWKETATIIICSSDIYSIKEQVELYTKIPPCDVFWSPHYNIPLLPIKAEKRVVTIHDTYHLAYKQTLSYKQKTYAMLVLKAAVKLSDKVVTVSEFSKREIEKYTNCPKEKVKKISNGVDHTLFSAGISESEEKTLRNKFFHLPKRYILYVGNVKPHKNLLTLLKAYIQLSTGLQKQYGLVIVGKKDVFITPDTELAKLLQKEPDLERQIVFTGFVPDALLPFFYKCASLFVFPSLYEGFGLPPLEAMACGCPVLASTAASLPEVCGTAAIYFNPLDAEELKHQLEKVLEDDKLQQELRKKGIVQSKKFSWKSSANEHIQLFNDLLTSH
ncbi:glycosyltransferase family 4 protein [Rufibacter tibetensis]|uniref:Glycosyl transferase family 1 n=1 Tax=Rufibacter tibetensis TaxID=512763 RepID=A0A0P0D0I5_9BACT|nr:glycosyltransferase family 1 protein [Rufibacter tibetensis]ALJ00320.1 hypothetical protein DC20_16760 [Rufibacter tibetensis]